jgi:hypothetical protein
MKRLNERIALWVTSAVATMGCVWAFTAWALIPLVWGDARDVVFYVSGGILQLVLLPVILVGQSLLARGQDVMAKEQHDAVLEVLADVREDHAELREVLQDVRKLVQRI